MPICKYTKTTVTVHKLIPSELRLLVIIASPFPFLLFSLYRNELPYGLSDVMRLDQYRSYAYEVARFDPRILLFALICQTISDRHAPLIHKGAYVVPK